MRLVWTKKSNRELCVTSVDNVPNDMVVFLTENTIMPIQAWCDEHKCGKRTSFDTFKFKSAAEMSMFLLRWSR